MRRPGLTINCDKSDAVPIKHERLRLGFNVDLSARLFIVTYRNCSLLVRIIFFVSSFLFIGPEVLLMLATSVKIGV